MKTTEVFSRVRLRSFSLGMWCFNTRYPCIWTPEFHLPALLPQNTFPPSYHTAPASVHMASYSATLSRRTQFMIASTVNPKCGFLVYIPFLQLAARTWLEYSFPFGARECKHIHLSWGCNIHSPWPWMEANVKTSVVGIPEIWTDTAGGDHLVETFVFLTELYGTMAWSILCMYVCI